MGRIASFLRPILVLLILFLVFGFVIIGYQGIRTLQQLTAVEAERDQWQRSSDIIGALSLKAGNTVVDLGSGSGYFALKLAPIVNPGTVLAVDIRQLPLRFLWVRTLIRRQHNVRTVLGEPNNSHLPGNSVDAVLIANTYHELDNPRLTLNQVSSSLVSGGRLVIVDPLQTEHGKLSAAAVESELRADGFEVIDRKDEFLNQPGGGPWWLIIARKP